MFNQKHCSPENKSKVGSCLTIKMLRRVASVLNKYNGSKIKLSSKKKELQEDISKEIEKISNCTSEVDWIKINIIKNELTDNEYNIFINRFRPEMPDEWKKNPNTWLSTNDIDKVLQQYENAYRNFEYMGANPIDFDLKIGGQCVANDICNIDIRKLKKNNKTSLGMVFNTDTHNESGEHWFSMFIDLKGQNIKGEPCIYYFDSLAKEPTEEIFNLVKRITTQCKKINKDIHFLFNDIKHQNGDTECGVYCLHFLVYLLKGGDFKKYITSKKSDKEMEKFREIFFIKNP